MKQDHAAPFLGHRNAPYWLLVVLAAAWLGLIVLAPWARRDGWLVAPLLYQLFYPICHQIAERSFHLDGLPLAVCHRCSGIYFGFLVGLLLLPSLHRLRRLLLDRPRLVLLFAVPMLVDVAIVVNTPATRFLSGSIAASPIGLLIWMAVDQLVRTRFTHLLRGRA